MIRKLLKKVKSVFYHNSENKSSLDSLSSLPRYTAGEFTYEGANLKFPDSTSFASTYKELFQNQIYKFNATNDSPIIIDCGANIGLSVIYFKKLYPNSKVIAFEPDIEIFKYLKYNLTVSKCEENVTLYNLGLWDSDGVIKFKNEGADAGRISFDYDETSFKSSIEIKTTRLSCYINNEIDFVKIDIEGAEVKVLQEIEPKLSLVKNMFIEYHSFVKSTQELDKILAILSRHDFEYYLDFPSKLRQYPFTENTSFLSFNLMVNIFAKKRV